MKMKLLLCTAAALAAFALAPAPAHAQSTREIHQRMEQRIGRIDALKARGTVGEDNRGYLAARGNLSGEDSALLAAENRDRASIYDYIAQQTGSTADQVGRQRARQLAQNSAPGVWVQDESGQWRQK